MSNHIRLAIADDHALLRQGLIALASLNGLQIVAEASNGVELIDMISKLDVLPDVCILDINMPVMNGYTTLAALKSRWPEIRVLALSMHATEFPILKMLRNGAAGYLLKDGPPEEFYTAITAVMNHGFYHSELVNEAKKAAGSKGLAQKITDKEMMFLSWCCCDLAYKEIAERMGISPRTVESYAEILCSKLSVKSRTGLVVAALSMGIEPAE